jgi:hypothetical protein
MQEDQAINRIREVRHRISEACNHDAHKLIAYYMKLQERHKERLIQATENQKEPEDLAKV